MGVQRSPLLTAANMGYLLSPQAQAVTFGGITWRTEHRLVRRGALTVTTTVSGLHPCSIEMAVNPLTPSEPKLQYLIGSADERFCARRLCVNTAHRPFAGTHKHIAKPGGGQENAYEPDDIPQVPLAPRVAPGVYRAILEAFAAECHIAIGGDFLWTEP